MLRSRAIKPDALHEFQTLGDAVLPYGDRPSPSFNRNKKIKEEWFSTLMLKGRKSGSKSVPGWCHECTMIERVDRFLHGEPSVRQPVSLIPCDNDKTGTS